MWFGALRSFRAGWFGRNKLLIWAAIIGVIAGVIQLATPLDQLMRVGRNRLNVSEASGQIVIAGIDEQSARVIGGWPWSRSEYADIVSQLNSLGARRIVFTGDFSDLSHTQADRKFLDAVVKSRAGIVLPTRFVIDPVTNNRIDFVPPKFIASHVSLANVNSWSDALTGVWDLPYALSTDGKVYPSVAALLGGRSASEGKSFQIDHSIDLRTIPVVDAADIILGKIDRAKVAGRDVVVGTTSRQFSRPVILPGRGFTPEIFAHVLGAETLRKGSPSQIPWALPLLAALAIAITALKRRRAVTINVVLVGSIVILLASPFALDRFLISVDVMPSIILLAIVTGGSAWSRFRSRSVGTNPVSGLPNLNALRNEEWAPNTALVAARIQNFPEITAALPPSLEKLLVDQIVGRISVGAEDSTIFQGDEGIFAWLVNKNVSQSIADELEALHALFRSPVVVEERHIDLDISFGVEVSGDRQLANRLGSALVAADEAYAEGLRWKSYDPAKLESAEWRLSLLSRLETAIDNGEIWVAFQPKYDIATKEICGAEALARWTHPEKGDISPVDFILAAEQHNRIEKLTVHVFNEAIEAAAAINQKGMRFGISVNLSARLLDNPGIPDVIAAIMARHRLPPELLTLEVTESAAMTNNDMPFANLDRLRAMGFEVSLDDYGTGFSTLEYLKKIPANEIKIDKSFVGVMHKSRGDQLVVNSTISLAHSLNRRVVAEGVERVDTLQALQEMGCDIAQGYLIGRPMPFHQFYSWITSAQVRMVA